MTAEQTEAVDILLLCELLLLQEEFVIFNKRDKIYVYRR